VLFATNIEGVMVFNATFNYISRVG
jgi:hypothetical protein